MLPKISDKKPDNILGRRRQGGGHRGRRRGAAAVPVPRRAARARPAAAPHQDHRGPPGRGACA